MMATRLTSRCERLYNIHFNKQIGANTMAQVDGQTVKVGDYVSFKCDIEQSGRITRIDGNRLTLENPYGFDGGYIGGQTVTTELAEDCWIEG
jgi:hypothetical protein